MQEALFLLAYKKTKPYTSGNTNVCSNEHILLQLQVQCSNETCPKVSDAVRKQFVLKEEKVDGKCCPVEEPVACRVGNLIYQVRNRTEHSLLYVLNHILVWA